MAETTDKIGLFNALKKEIALDIDHLNKWRLRAREDFAFVDGGKKQWDADAIRKLEDQDRPIVTFNKTRKYIKAICGIEANNRHEIAFLPRELSNVGEVKANELLTAASEWMEDGCHASRHQSRAFRDAATCGIGGTEGVIDYDDDPQGQYVETRFDPLEIGWDREAREQNLTDAKRVWRVRQMSVKDARAIVPGAADMSASDLDAFWAGEVIDPKNEPKTTKQKEQRDENTTGQDDDDQKVRIVQVQWWEYETYYRAANPDMLSEPMFQGKTLIDMDKQQFESVNRKYGAMHPTGKWPGTAMRRKVYKQGFLGSALISSAPAPCPTGFTFNFITWEPNSDGTFDGLITDLRDPQVWGNKFFAQVMHIINATAKGGIIVESDAIDDVNEFKANYPKPEGVAVVRPGTIAKGKIMAKPGQGLTAGVLALMEITDRMFSDVSGINVEMMGLADREQAGVLEAQRKQAAMTILATLFDSMSLFRERVAKVRIHYIQTILADGRLIRVAGDDYKEAIPLIKDKVMGKYDVVVTDAPTSPNSKERIWASLQQILPPLMQAGMVKPEHVLVLLDYIPGLPAKLAQTFRDMAAKPDEGAQKQAELAERAATADVADKEASAESKRANAVLALAKAGSAQMQVEEAQFNAALAAYNAGRQPKPIQEGNIMGPDGTQPPQPRELPEMGENEAEQQAAPMPQTNGGMAMPGGLVTPGGM